MRCQCHFVPAAVFDRFSKDTSFSTEERLRHQAMATATRAALALRVQATEHLMATLPFSTALTHPYPPQINVNDCSHSTTLPGSPVSNPGSSGDATVKRCFDQTTKLASFYKDLFGRNSIDGQGMAMISSVHYGTNFNNAFWNTTQMVYGDGDGQLFIDLTNGPDVIGHENTHGVTQHTLGLVYQNQPGGLNESISDVFGSMFEQWEAGQDVNQASWLIGANIMGAGAKSRGYTCLRDMSDTNATHALTQQPDNISGYHDGMDPHISSGIGNHAFYNAAKAIGGHSWEKTGKVWYAVLTKSGHQPNMTYKQFADACRAQAKALFPKNALVYNGIDAAWKSAGL